MKKTRQKHRGKNRRRINSKRLLKEGTKGLDQIKENLEKNGYPSTNTELPGEGKFYCTECDRFFVNESSQQHHLKSKVHKKRLKELSDVIHSQKHADMAAGLF